MSPEAGEVKRWLEKADHDRRIVALAIEQSPTPTWVLARIARCFCRLRQQVRNPPKIIPKIPEVVHFLLIW